MATKYYAVLTNVGAAKLANATALGAQVEITQMAVGDGNGVLPTPNPAQTALVHELRRKPLNSLSIDPNNANQIIAEQVIPEDEGGWWIREIGLFDKDGDMIAVANCAETYKPQLQEGSGRVQVVRMILIVSSTAAVTLKIDPSVVLATRQYVDDQIIQVKSYVDQKMAAHVAAADPHKQYAPKESPALTGRPTAPTAEGKDSSTQIANTAFVQAAIAALVGSSPEALDTLNELAAALGNDPNFATTVTNSLAGKMDKSANGSDIENVSVFLQNLGLEGIQVTAESFGVVSGLVSITVAKSNADKIMQKAAELSAAGGGRIVFTKSLYQVHMDESDFSSSTATIRVAALRIPYDNVILCGQGWNSTTIQAYATNSAYGVIQWSKAPLQNGITKVHGVGLHNICIDGNYHGDFTSASYVRQTEGVVGAGIEGLSINNLKVKNCSHYGLGLQNGGYKGCVIDGYW